MSNLSPSTLALLRAAKNDAPSKQSRNAIWGGVTSGLVTHTPLHITPQAGAGPATAPIGASAAPAALAGKGVLASAAGLTGMKGAFVGALFGSAISIGVATFMLRAKPADVPRAPLSAQASTQVGDASKSINGSTSAPSNTNASTTDVQELDTLLPSGPATTKSGSSQNSGTSAIASGSHDKSSSMQASASNGNAKSLSDETQSLHSKKSSSTTDSIALDDDTLTRETSLVADAHRAEHHNDFAGALKAVRTARSLEKRQFEPEEMAIEARALHGLGRDDEAAKIESKLRSMYPNQSL